MSGSTFEKFMLHDELVSLSYFSILHKDLFPFIHKVFKKSDEQEEDERKLSKGFLIHPNNNNKHLYYWGRYENYNIREGQTIIQQMNPQMFDFNSVFKSTIQQIGCGRNHTLFLTNNGKCFSLGLNNGGQLGLGDHIHSVSHPEKIDFDECIEIEEVMVGESHNFAFGKNKLTMEKQIFCWGWNDIAQLGNVEDNQFYPILFDFKEEKIHANIKQILCGYNHTLVLTQKGDCFSFGGNCYNQLGRNKNLRSRKIDLPGIIFEELVGGAMHHFAFVREESNNSRQIYCWGSNYSGQLGIGKSEHKILPTLFEFEIKHDVKIKKIICGFDRTFIVSKDRQLYGSGIVTQDINYLNKFVRINLSEKINIDNAAVGKFHTFVFGKNKQTNQYQINCSGKNFHGQLGYNNNDITSENKFVWIKMKKKNKECQQIITSPWSNYNFGVF